MNVDFLADYVASAERKVRHEFALCELGLEPLQRSLLTVVSTHGVTAPPDELCRRVPEYARPRGSTPADVAAALHEALGKGWLQIVDDAARERIRAEIGASRLIGPVAGYPAVGVVDLTEAGAALMRRYEESMGNTTDLGCAWECVHRKSTHYFPSAVRAQDFVRRMSESDDYTCTTTEPVPIGAWRAQWWRRFEQGYRVDFEWHARFQGLSAKRGESLHSPLDFSQLDRPRMSRALARSGVDLAEWMALVDQFDGNRFDQLSGWIGFRPSDEDVVAGIEAALRRGWLQVRDDCVESAIARAIVADVALRPGSSDDTLGTKPLTFTVEGAERYRELCREILGPACEDYVAVRDCTYRRMHYYSTWRARLTDRWESDDSEPFEPPTEIHEERIGPWCDRWYERHAAGYHYDATYGTP